MRRGGGSRSEGTPVAGGDGWGRPAHLGGQVHPGAHHCWRCVCHPEHKILFTSLLTQQRRKRINFVPLKMLLQCAKDSSPKICQVVTQLHLRAQTAEQVTARSAGSGAANDVTKKTGYCISLENLFPFLPSSLLPWHRLVAGGVRSRVSSALPASSA